MNTKNILFIFTIIISLILLLFLFRNELFKSVIIGFTVYNNWDMQTDENVFYIYQTKTPAQLCKAEISFTARCMSDQPCWNNISAICDFIYRK